MNLRLPALLAELASVNAEINRITDGGCYCKFCGATDVYWMTVMGRREAEFTAKINNNPLILKLAKAKLFNTSGGEHVCPIPNPFNVEPE